MKRLSKAIVLLLSAIMVLAMSTSVFAADPPTSGSITVNPNFKGQTYTLKKLFDAQITFNEDGTQRAITYTLPAGKSLEGNQWFELNENGFVVPKTGVTDDWAKDPAAIDWAESFGTAVEGCDPITADSDNDGDVKWEGLPFGYYFVQTTMGSFISIDSTNPDATIRDKNAKPTIDKEITGVNGSKATLGVGDNTADPGQGESEKAIAQIGDTVGFKLTVAAKPGAQNYVVTDTLPAGLTAPAADGVSVSSDDIAITASDYTVTVTGQEIKVEFKQPFLDKITANASIFIEYNAVLNKSAVIGLSGNTNNVELTWGNDPDSEDNKSVDESTVYTAQVEVQKNDDKEKALAGAGFVVKNSAGKFYKLVNGVVTWVDSMDNASEHVSGTDGKVAAFTGLGNGTYSLVEKTVPAGYNKLDDTKFEVAPKNYTDENLKQSETVVNKTGTELPSTGGIGTVIFYVLGSALLIGCGIVLISRKRMQK